MGLPQNKQKNIIYSSRPTPSERIGCMIAQNEYEVQLCRKNHTKIGMDSFPLDIYEDLIRYYLSKGKIRNAMYLVCQANWGMRVGDTLSVRFCHIFTERGTFKESFTLKDGEQKTGKQNIYYNNDAVKAVISMYLSENPHRKIYEYIFCSESNNSKKINLQELDKNAPDITISNAATTQCADDIVKNGLIALGIHTENGRLRNEIVNCNLKLDTHSLRKTFGEVFYKVGCDLCDSGEIELNIAMLKTLQQKFEHSETSVTRRYNSAMEKTFRDICMNINIGMNVLEDYL